MVKLTFDEAAAYLKGRDGELNAQLAHMGGAPLDALQRQFAAEESELSTLRRARDNDAQRATTRCARSRLPPPPPLRRTRRSTRRWTSCTARWRG
jgi:hypothetical protein